MNNLYQTLQKIAITENRKVEKQLKRKLYNFDKIYYQTTMPFKDRQLKIRWIKLPTFMWKDKPTYYAAFLNNIEYWRKGEIKDIYQQTIECIDKKDVDQYSIFLSGKLYGHIDTVENKPLNWYKTFILNTTEFTKQHQNRIYNTIIRFLSSRCKGMEKEGKIFGNIQKDVDRLNSLTETLKLLKTDYNVVMVRN